MPARPTFIELPSRDIDGARLFYATVFGWEMVGFGPSYASTLGGTVDVGLQSDPDEVTRAPLAVIEVDDLEAALRAIEAAGGRVSKPAFAFPGGRRFQFLDPNGNELAAMQRDPDWQPGIG